PDVLNHLRQEFAPQAAVRAKGLRQVLDKVFDDLAAIPGFGRTGTDLGLSGRRLDGLNIVPYALVRLEGFVQGAPGELTEPDCGHDGVGLLPELIEPGLGSSEGVIRALTLALRGGRDELADVGRQTPSERLDHERFDSFATDP